MSQSLMGNISSLVARSVLIGALRLHRLWSYHWALYILLIVQPFVGWIATSAYRAPMTMFWLFELPPIWGENRALSEDLFLVHRNLGLLIAALLVAHIGAALFHHFVRKDGVLLRMIGR